MSVVFEKGQGRFLATGPFDQEMPHHYIIITDYVWWVAHEHEIYDWMRACFPRGIAHHQVMVVVVEHDHDASNFLLRWS